MAKTQILDYTIYLQDAELVAQIQAQIDAGAVGSGPYTSALLALPTGGFAIYMAPDLAATFFADLIGAPPFPVWNVEDSIVPSAGGSIRSEWFHVNNTFPKNVPTFEKSSGWWIFGSTTRFYWAGHVVYEPPATGSPAVGEEPTTPENELLGFAERLFLYGGLQPSAGEIGDSGTTTNLLKGSQAGNRLGDNLGIRVGTSSIQIFDELALQSLDPPVTTLVEMWQRFYIRPHKFGSPTVRFWRAHQQSVSSTGFSLGITATGQLALFNDEPTATLVSTFGQLEEGVAARIDLFGHINQVANTMTLEVRINGVDVASSSRAPGGIQVNRVWNTTSIGRFGIGTAIYDLSDWVVARSPKTHDDTVAAWNIVTAYSAGNTVTQGGAVYYALQANTGQIPGGASNANWMRLSEPIDLVNGSHLARARSIAFGPDHASWTGDFRLLQQRPQNSASQVLTSSTSGAPLQVELDMAGEVDPIPGSMGWVAIRVVAGAAGGGAADGQLGYKIGAAAEVNVSVSRGLGTQQHNAITATIDAAETVPLKGEALLIKYTKSANVSATSIYSLNAIVECIGVFGPEDAPPVDLARVPTQVYEFPFSPWARGVLPLGPVIIVGGTYVGNSLGQDLAFKAPPVLIWIRPVTGDTGGGHWWTGMLAAHDGADQGLGTTIIPGWQQDLGFSGGPDDDQQMAFSARLAGANTQSNANGVTYQYIAFCDPAGRFSRAWTSVFGTNDLPKVDAIDDPEFTGEWAFTVREEFSATTTAAIHCKGPGLAADEIQPLGGGAGIANALTVGAGELTIGAGLYNQEWANIAALLFRRADGNDDPGQARVLFVGTYTGDGAASRTISIAPASGRRPLWAAVVGSNASFQRDPSHTTNTSTNPVSGASSTTGITAGGIDAFTVGVTLNTNGVVYNYFGFPGGTDAGNGGWSQNGEQVPVASDSNNPSDWEEPEIIDPDEPEPPGPNPLDPGDLDTDIDADCVASSTRICNQALSECGITVQLTDLATDTSQEAYTCRLHYRTVVEEVLRDYPWLFARRVTTDGLTFIEGTIDEPVNSDWTYSYALPTDCLRVLRIVDPVGGRRRESNHLPIAFTQTQDDTPRNVLLTNEPEEFLTEDDPLNIEYIRRVPCPGRVTDAAFRWCLIYRLASVIGKPLGKDQKDSDALLLKYRAHVPKVKVQHANDQERQRPTDVDPDWITGR